MPVEGSVLVTTAMFSMACRETCSVRPITTSEQKRFGEFAAIRKPRYANAAKSRITPTAPKNPSSSQRMAKT